MLIFKVIFVLGIIVIGFVWIIIIIYWRWYDIMIEGKLYIDVYVKGYMVKY